MKKYFILAIALAILCGINVSARAESIGFEIGTMYYDSNENTAKSGSGSFLAISLPIDAKTTIGFYREGLKMQLRDDKLAAALPTTISLEMSTEAMEITRNIAQGFDAGIHIGMLDLTAYNGGALAWTDTVPMGDIFIKWDILSGGDKIKTDLTATLGYRSLFITPVDPDVAAGDFVKPVDDLGGVWFAISLALKF